MSQNNRVLSHSVLGKDGGGGGESGDGNGNIRKVVDELDERRFPVDWRSSYLLGASEKDAHLIFSAIFGNSFQSSARLGEITSEGVETNGPTYL